MKVRHLRQVLGGLGFPCARGPGRRPAQIEMHGARQSDVAAVSERSDDQATRAPHVLEPVREAGIALHHVTGVGLGVPLVS